MAKLTQTQISDITAISQSLTAAIELLETSEENRDPTGDLSEPFVTLRHNLNEVRQEADRLIIHDHDDNREDTGFLTDGSIFG